MDRVWGLSPNSPRSFDQALLGQPVQLGVDLRVLCGPDGAERLREPPRQVVSAGRALREQAERKAPATADPHRVALYDDHLGRFGKAIANRKTGPVEAVAATVVTAVEARDPKRRYAVRADVRVYGMPAHAPAGLREQLVTRAFGLRGVRAGGGAP